MRYFLFITFLFLNIYVFSQDYNRAAGIRLGEESGICYKRFMNDEKAIEARLGFKFGGLQFTLLRQFHQPISMKLTNNLFFYYGYGVHFGYKTISSEEITINGNTYYEKIFSFGFGVDANLGLEYHFLNLPLTLVFDYKPYYEINIPFMMRNSNIDFGISLFYTF